MGGVESAGEVGIEGIGFVVVDPTSIQTTTSSSLSYIILSVTNPLLVNQVNQEGSILNSLVVNITLTGGAVVSSSLQVCLAVNDTTTKDACLGYIDEFASPPQWICEDKCLKQSNDNYLCGRTKHLTSFAVLFGGVANEAGGGSDCGDDDKNYILGSYDKDLTLVAAVAGFVILLAVIFFVIFSYSPLKKFAYGKEGNRNLLLRRIQQDTAN